MDKTPGFKTTEFWGMMLTNLFAITLLILGQFKGSDTAQIVYSVVALLSSVIGSGLYTAKRTSIKNTKMDIFGQLQGMVKPSRKKA